MGTDAVTPLDGGLTAFLAEVDTTLDVVLAELERWDESEVLTAGADPRFLCIDLVGELRRGLRAGGKRVRPVFGYWGWVGAGGTQRSQTRVDLVRVGAALELLHYFALVQDDVMDQSDHRRGRPTVHVEARDRHRRWGGLGEPERFGDSVAVLLGDLALHEASMLVSTTGAPLLRLWRQMTVELVHGQLWDLTQAACRGRRVEISRAIARLKTGRYSVTRPLQLGATAAQADPALVAALGQFGDLVGDAFAIRDDILGIWGDPAITGKPAGDDLREAKPTLLLTLASQRVPPDERDLWSRCDAGILGDDDVRRLADDLVDWGVRDEAEAVIVDLVRRAEAALAELTLPVEAREALLELLHSCAWRQS